MTRTSNLLGTLATLIHDATLQKMGDVGVPCDSDLAALNVLRHHPNTRIEALRRILQISHSACVRVAERLMARKLITKAPADDARAVLLNLTPAGLALVGQLSSGRRQVLENAIAGLSKTDIEALDRICAQILTVLVEDGPAAETACRFCDEARCHPCPIEYDGENSCDQAVVP